MGICGSVMSSNRRQKGPIKDVQNPYSNRSGNQTGRTNNIVVTYPGEKFFVNQDELEITNTKSIREKSEIYLSLHDAPQKNVTYQIKVSICHDYKLNQYINLGSTEELLIVDKEGAFSTKFIFDYHFEKEQILGLEVIRDYVSQERLLLSIGKIMGSRNLLSSVPLQKSQGMIRIQANRSMNSNSSSLISMFKVFSSIPSQNNKKSSSIFYVISQRDQATYKMVYKSNEFSIGHSTQEMLNQFEINTQALCSNNIDVQYKIDVYFVPSMIHVGFGYFLLSDLRSNANKGQMTMVPLSNSSGMNGGHMQIQYAEEPKMTFIDYLRYGMEINLVIAIDYSASNQDPNFPTSNHYVHGDNNNYEQAISSCGKILGYYDHDQQFPVFGFGAKPPGSYDVQHCFPVNFQSNPCLFGIDNVIAAYRNALMNVTLMEPTCFSPVIKGVMNRIANDQKVGDNKYYILLLLTDGMINDLRETCDLIVDASYYPLSIIIIGIGNADFKQMITLDGDDFLLTNSKGVQRKRDLVQFVRFNDYKDNIDALTQNVCEEIPQQVEKYYHITKTFVKKGVVSNLL